MKAVVQKTATAYLQGFSSYIAVHWICVHSLLASSEAGLNPSQLAVSVALYVRPTVTSRLYFVTALNTASATCSHRLRSVAGKHRPLLRRIAQTSTDDMQVAPCAQHDTWQNS